MTCKTKTCKYEGNLAGQSHIKCEHSLVKDNMGPLMTDLLSTLGGRGNISTLPDIQISMRIIGNVTGIKNGWFNWPFNFDPVWLDKCDSFEEKEK